MGVGLEGERAKVYGTRYSQAVTHPSTNRARRCLTSVIGREPVLSTWYGRRRLLVSSTGSEQCACAKRDVPSSSVDRFGAVRRRSDVDRLAPFEFSFLVSALLCSQCNAFSARSLAGRPTGMPRALSPAASSSTYFARIRQAAPRSPTHTVQVLLLRRIYPIVAASLVHSPDRRR